MAGTFSGTTTSTYTLTTNPTTITSSGTVDVNSTVASAAGILGTAGVAWTVTNLGTVESVGSLGIGVDLLSGGLINNGTSGSSAGYIAGSQAGILIAGSAGTVVNYGTVISTGTSEAIGLLAGVSKVINHGIVSSTNTGTAGIGIFLGGSGGTITNLGTVEDAASNRFAIQLGAAGGEVINGQPGSTAGLITGYHGGVGFFPGTATNPGTLKVVNYGTILSTQPGTAASTGFNGFAVQAGTNGIATIDNFGMIAASQTAGGAGILLQASGLVTNEVGGVIDGAGGNGISAAKNGAAVTVTNLGTVRNESSTNGTVYLGTGGIVTNGATNVTGALIAATDSTGISVKNIAATVVNFGTVEHTGTGTGGQAIYFGAGGTVTNYGLISGAHPGSPTSGYPGVISANNQPVTVVNFGTIDNPNNSNGINLLDGGLLINGSTSATSALINAPHTTIYMGGSSGVPILGAIGTIVNYGTIENTTSLSSVISLVSGGTAINHGLIESPRTGVAFSHTAGTIDNFGTIVSTAPLSGTRGTGAYLGAGGLITNEAGGLITALRSAVAIGNTAATSTPAIVSNLGILTGSVGVTIGAADSASNTIVNFGTITGTSGTAINLGTVGSQLVVIGSNSSLQGVITNLLPGDSFDLPFMTFSSSGTVTVVSNGTVSQQLQVVENAGTFTIALDPNQNFSSDIFQLGTDSGTGTLITEAVCFCRGTLILTEQGEVPVEDLKIGDQVKTLGGAYKPIVWIGFGRDLVTRANRLARPVIVRRGALADNVPRRDLYLTHGHALYFDGVLIPVENLVNHRSIRWDDTARVVEYYHIELADHDVVFAEGAPAESYYDANNRAFFQNMREGSAAGADKPTFAPVLNAGETVERAWARLFDRAGGQIERNTTDDPDLHLVIAGERLDPVSRAAGVYTFALAGPPADPLRLCSRSGVPSLVGLNRHEHRRLGVAIRQIILSRPGVMTCLDHDAPPFRDGGCHLPEVGHSWTDGEIALPAELFAHLRGGFTLLVHTSKQTMRYPIAAPVAAAA